METECVISFRKHFWTSRYPIEARLYSYGGSEGVYTLTSQIIHLPDELCAFQVELLRREEEGEWIFIAYYELLAR
jgi:hypothetical protein